MATPVVSPRVDGPAADRPSMRTMAIVGALVRLRFRVLGNSLRRSTWQMVGAIIGALYGLGVLGVAVLGMIGLAFAPAELRGTLLVILGSALVLGWVILPLLTSGVDQTLDPAKLAVFPIPLNTLILGLGIAGVLGVPGIVTGVAALATSLAYLGSPLAMIAAVPSALVGLLTCVLASRVITSASSGLTSHRRLREVLGILIFIPLILLGPIVLGAARGIANIADTMPGIATTLGWTPIGAAWAVPSAVEAGDPLGAALRFLIAIATLALLVLLWRSSLAAALVRRSETTGKTVARGKLGMFGRLPATPAGAVTARALTYWIRDPRYARQLIIVPLIPALLVFYAGLNDNPFLINLTAPLIAFMTSLAIYADLSYDGTAFAAHVIDGVGGRADRTGRAAALGIIALPLIVIAAFITTAFTGGWVLLPAILGVSLGLFLTGVGLCSVSSAKIVIPVPAPGDNPFKSAPGAGFTTAFSAFATWGLLVLFALPVFVLGVVTVITGAVLWSWVTLVVGVVYGVVMLTIGIRVGGRAFDRSAPDLLMRLKRLRGA